MLWRQRTLFEMIDFSTYIKKQKQHLATTSKLLASTVNFLSQIQWTFPPEFNCSYTRD